ncbi:RING-type E3 ubiquitin transferase [Ranunculus cassubicifolius]
MPSGFEESSSQTPLNSSCSSNNENSDATSFESSNNDAGSFECNICFELAQDPIVTLCGHLYCWPCLYKWLHMHSHSQECPVCKALIQEEKLVPLYGRGKTPTDPRSKSIPGDNIPNRPSGQRPETAPPPNPNHFHHQGFGFMGGHGPTATARLGNFTLSAALNGIFPSLFSLQVHGFPDTTMYGAPGANFHYGYPNVFHGGHAQGFQRPATRSQQVDSNMPILLLALGLLVILGLIYS